MRKDYDDDGLGRGREADGGPRSELMEAVDQLSRRLSGAVMLAGGLIAVGLYAGSDGQEAQTYQAFAADGEVFRVNTDSGTIIACNATPRCIRVLGRGQELAEDQGNSLFRVPAATQLPAPQQTAPAAQPAVPAAQPGPPRDPAPALSPPQPK